MSQYVKEIITDVDKLGEWSTEIDPSKEGKLLQEIVLSLKHTMREKDLVSLAAPQIGYQRRVFCIRFGKNDYRTFVNPLIENNTGFQLSRETCSSIPGKTFIRPRFGNIKVFFTTPMGKIESSKIVGRSAIVFEHCLDHLNGLLLSDIGLEIDELFDNATDEERAEVVKLYMESLDIRQKELEKEISTDEELTEIADAAKFIASVNSGDTQIEQQPAANK